ncbi:MAG: choice-of-anchor D domain-containing protein, partial [Candidatus Sumerlaeota bacterium]|nr:choice-of-anchor D domain-containing protein [Candidatus Sumerlaeota bacterium]
SLITADNATTIAGNRTFPLFLVNPIAYLNLDGVGFTRGNATGNGGAINNAATYGPGAAQFSARKCAFYDNQAMLRGGALNLVACAATLTDCVFTSNATTVAGATNCGGAINFDQYGNSGVEATVTRCRFENNIAVQGGGAAQHIRGAQTYYDCWFIKNIGQNRTASGNQGGGAIHVREKSILTAYNCVFAANTSGESGGVIKAGGTLPSSDAGAIQLINCTFWNNASTANTNDGLYYNDTLEPGHRLLNCIFEGHRSAFNRGGTATIAQAFNCLFGISATNTVTGLANNNPVYGSPSLVNPYSGNFDLRDDSAAIGAGAANGGGVTAPAADILGRLRNLGNPDIGAFEVPATAPLPPSGLADMYVKPAPSGTGDGSSWDNATTIAPAVANVSGNGVIFMARGVHTLNSALNIAKNVSIYGGFVGTELRVSERSEADILGANATTITAEYKSRVMVPASITTLTLDGLCITRGQYAGGGAGVYTNNNVGNLIVRKCIFHDNNSVAGNGAAIRFNQGVVEITDCIFTSNTAWNNTGSGNHAQGGALLLIGISGGVVNVTLTRSVFEQNWAREGGGAIFAEYCKLTANDCRFTANYVDSSCGGDFGGGAMRKQNGGKGTLNNCVFEFNESATVGGAIQNQDSNTIEINNCVFSNNTAGTRGGAIKNYTSTANISQSRFAHNVSHESGGAIHNANAGAVNLSECRFVQNDCSGTVGTENGGGAIHSREDNSTLLATNCVFTSNTSDEDGGAIKNSNSVGGGVILIHCTFVGNSSSSSSEDGLRLDDVGTAKNILVNCIFDGHRVAVSTFGTGTQVAAYNCLFGANQTNTANNTALTNCMQNTDPVFIAYANGDCDLSALSPAVNTGAVQSDVTMVTLPAYDIAGRLRMGIPDMGAFELAQPVFTLTPNPLHFGAVNVGATSDATILLSNTGNVPGVFEADKWTTTAPYSILTPFAGTLAVGSTTTMNLRFAPVVVGDFTGSLGYADAAVPVTPATLRGATPPEVISMTRIESDPTSAGLVSWLVTFTQPMANVDTTDFALATTGAFSAAPAIIAVIPAGATAIVSANTGTGDGLIQLMLSGGADAAEATYFSVVTNKPFAGEIYDFDNVPPTLLALIPGEAGPTSATSVVYDLVFSEPIPDLTLGSFNVSLVSGAASGAVSNLTEIASKTTWTVTLDNLDTPATAPLGGVLRLDVIAAAALDDHGNALAGSPMGGTVASDRTAPQLDPAAGNVEPSSGSVLYSLSGTTITISEPVTNVTIDKLTITSGGANVYRPLGFTSSGGGQTYSFVFDDVFGTGPVTLNVALVGTSGTTIVDQAGNPLATRQWSYIQDKSVIPVVVASAEVALNAYTSRTALTFTATFMTDVTNFISSDLAVVNATVVSFSGSGTAWTFQLAPLAQGLVSVQIPSGVCNAVSPATRVNATSNLYQFIFDSIVPVASGLDAAPQVAATGTTITVSFTASEPLAPGIDPIITVNGGAVTLKTKVALYYEYQYIVPALDPDGYAIIAVTLTDRAYNTSTTVNQSSLLIDRTPPTAVIEAVQGDPDETVAIQFSEPVTGVDLSDFSLTCNGAPVADVSNFAQVSTDRYTVRAANARPGIYVMTLHAAGSGIKDRANILMQTDATRTWMVSAAGSDVQMWTRY